MKGIVFNLLQDVVTQAYGADTWDDLLDAAGLAGSYTSLGSYADEEIVKLVMAASQALKLPPEDILRWFGQRAMPLLAERYPGFFEPHKNARSFLLTLNRVIHSEVRKLYPGAATPEFEFDASDPEVLLVKYDSARRMCALADGFMRGAADYYGETVTIDHPVSQCMLHGAPHCLFTLRFAA